MTSAELFPATRQTKLPGGYMGKLLRVDLTSGTIRSEPLPDERLLRKLWGGQALATYFLLKELPRFVSILRDDDLIARLRQRRLKQAAGDRIVFGDQNLHDPELKRGDCGATWIVVCVRDALSG